MRDLASDAAETSPAKDSDAEEVLRFEGVSRSFTGFAAVGIDPGHFNLQAGLKPTLAIAGVSAIMSSLICVAAYLKQSPLPSE